MSGALGEAEARTLRLEVVWILLFVACPPTGRKLVFVGCDGVLPPPPLEDPELVEGLPPDGGVGDGVGEGVGLGVEDGATLFKKSSTDQPSGVLS